jgi:serine phosphatase RsbU (regulator of sigma subunit)
MFFVFVFVLKNFGFLPSNFFTERGIQIGSACEVLLLTFAIIDRFRSFKEDALQKAMELSEYRLKVTEELELKVEERTNELQVEKKKLEFQTEELISSIRYAQQLQKALLPGKDFLDTLFKDYFVFYNPKDIVSGDFYWASKTRTTREKSSDDQSLTLLAVGDCTGHGVPGAFMSVMAINLLKQSKITAQVNTPGEALGFIHSLVVASLNGDTSEIRLKDGMDVALIAIDDKKKTIYYAGANNAVYIIRNNELFELEPSRFSIGSEKIDDDGFRDSSFEYQSGDCLYLFTDGFPDQFGGPSNKKFLYKRFKELLCKISSLPFKEQQRKLQNAFEEWKGTEDQTDDVCVFGLRL